MNRKTTTRFFPELGTLKRNAVLIKTNSGEVVRISVSKHRYHSKAVKLTVHSKDNVEILDEDILILEENNRNFR